MPYNFILENINLVYLVDVLFASFKVRVERKVALYGAVELGVFLDHHDFDTTIRALFRAFDPVGHAPAAIIVETRHQSHGLMHD